MISESPIHTIAFYNTENLFDVYVDKKTNDNDFLPISVKNWTKKRYEKKIQNLGYVISKIGFDSIDKPPVLIGLAEVENKRVLSDLVQSDHLKNFNYAFIHFDSEDERGIDVALLYNQDEFILEHSINIPVFIEDETSKREFTRDILLVIGYLEGNKIHVLINHWPSRHEGKEESEYKRLIASSKLSEIISSIINEDEEAQILILGDFNDNPNSKSLLNLKNKNDLFNTMESVWSYNRGSVNHNFTWILFDQILLTSNFLNEWYGGFGFLNSDIFDDNWLKESHGKFKGQPFRTYAGKRYIGGFSDHFPVFIQIQRGTNYSV